MKSLLKFLALSTPMLIGLPLIGVWLHPARSVSDYLEFPPLTRHVVHAPFSWAVFIVMAGGVAAVVLPVTARLMRARSGFGQAPSGANAQRRFPWWGWCAVGFGSVSWLLAWTRFSWFAPLQIHTFTPLWIAYIVVVNALAWRRSGKCMMLDRPLFFAALFPFSAGFWWFFEYLNRFVQNWYYVGIADLSAGQYFWFATFPFATVLPAVLGTQEWLLTFPIFRRATGQARPFRLAASRPFGVGLLLLSAFTLAGLGVWPSVLYPLVWIAPLLLLLAVQLLTGAPSLLDAPARGDWSPLVAAAAGCLICGFFWEMWNIRSLAKWVYSVPYVHRFLVFEMPLLGFAGYIPFGIECLALGELVRGALERTAV